ncbi:hypothetical protein [Mucilaginibacter sp. AK015]|uniref:hypothetical protein n=1 Tax=Mucilaginibacter sp. AK015 TaxID=2723072 RepID=UPI00161710B3|nr:hypothetical protein [Mucilaginibacter sp. AK015]MBB5396526.1 hypothetical protein [Mucilaginibacter sp. AK015]
MTALSPALIVKLVIGLLITTGGVTLIFKFFNKQKPITKISSNDVSKDIEISIVDTLNTYDGMATQLHLTYVLLGCIAIISSVFVTTFIASDTAKYSSEYLPYVSFASTASLTLITAFNLGAKANNCRAAWRYLDYAFSRYKTKEITIAELLKARFEAETIMGGVDFQYKP